MAAIVVDGNGHGNGGNGGVEKPKTSIGSIQRAARSPRRPTCGADGVRSAMMWNRVVLLTKLELGGEISLETDF